MCPDRVAGGQGGGRKRSRKDRMKGAIKGSRERGFTRNDDLLEEHQLRNVPSHLLLKSQNSRGGKTLIASHTLFCVKVIMVCVCASRLSTIVGHLFKESSKYMSLFFIARPAS